MSVHAMKSDMRIWFSAREEHLTGWAEGMEADDNPMALAFTLEALGVSPAGFSRLLEARHNVQPHFVPAALTDLCDCYRISVARTDGRAPVGTVVGYYGEFVFVAWSKSESQMRAK